MTHFMHCGPIIRGWFGVQACNIRTLLMAGCLSAALSSQAQILITKWDFNAANLQPSVGSGTISLIGGTTATFAGGFDDENVGWRTSDYPTQGQNNLTAGIQMQVSTVGKTGITLSYAVRHGIESANRQSVLWSTDNSNYQPAQVFTFAPQASGTGDTWYTRSVNLPAGADNQPNLYLRIVSNFTPGLSAYTASQLGTAYSGSGPWRFDDVSFSAVPEPATSAAAAAAALIGFALLRRRRVP
ncbi:MAG: hypothetical protein RIT19_1687 [Verrucomicrobiota bacterium]|jgi:hypothetical protein